MAYRTKAQIQQQVNRINSAIAELQQLKKIDKIQAKVLRKKLNTAAKYDLIHYCNTNVSD